MTFLNDISEWHVWMTFLNDISEWHWYDVDIWHLVDWDETCRNLDHTWFLQKENAKIMMFVMLLPFCLSILSCLWYSFVIPKGAYFVMFVMLLTTALPSISQLSWFIISVHCRKTRLSPTPRIPCHAFEMSCYSWPCFEFYVVPVHPETSPSLWHASQNMLSE